MSLQFVGPRGSFEVRWITYALLRDGVRSELEGGGPDPLLEPVHGISRALGASGIRLSARDLRLAMLAVRASLYDLPCGVVLVSGETMALITGAPACGGAVESDRSEPVSAALADPMARSFGEMIAPIVEPLLAITEGALEEDLVEVRDL